MTVKEGFLFLHAFSVLPLDMGILETDQLSLSFLQSTRMWTSVISMYPENIWWHKKEKPENSITWYKVSPSVVHVTRVIKWNYCRRYTGKLLFFMPIYLFDRSLECMSLESPSFLLQSSFWGAPWVYIVPWQGLIFWECISYSASWFSFHLPKPTSLLPRVSHLCR